MTTSTAPVIRAATEPGWTPAMVSCSWRMAIASTAMTIHSGRSARMVPARLLRGRYGGLQRNLVADRRQRRHDALGRERDDHFRSLAELRAQCEAAAMQVDQPLDDGEPEARALLGAFDRVGSLAERRQHDGDFFLRNAGPRVAHADVLAARGGPADLDPDLAGLRRELDRIGKKIEADLADRPLVGPDLG